MDAPTPIYRGVEVFALEGHPRALELGEEGLSHPKSARSRDRLLTPYADISHLATSRRALFIGARRSVYSFPREAFVDPNGPENVVRALRARIARRPGGPAQLLRMAEIEALAHRSRPLRATWGVLALCGLIFLLQLGVGTVIQEVGYFSPILVADGDLWRLVTANLLHAAPSFPLHLIFNALGLLAFGFLVERPLGAARALVVMGASALGAMAGSAAVGESQVVGASGVVFGLVGSALWLELRCAGRLPSWWRIPRRVFFLLLAVNGALNVLAALMLPILAWGAHLGGFLAGLGCTVLLTPRRVPSPPSSLVRLAAAGVLGGTLLSLVGAAGLLVSTEDFLADHAARLATLPGVSPIEMNDRAWLIAIEPGRSEAQARAALALAERAVTETGRSIPALLDTLAELQFQLGSPERALGTIDEAIALVPDDPRYRDELRYYTEQRRRFQGERSADDRPEGPSWWRSPPPEPPAQEPAGGLTAALG